jgi:integrase
MSSILETILKPLGIANPIRLISKKREKQALHKPYSDIPSILQEIKSYNHNLYLCCLLTYGCLLRPHQEIRLLTWSDFSEDLSYISLSGKRNKSGRNRIVPVSVEIRKELSKGEPSTNIFTGTEKPFNEEYFKLLWRRFKEVSLLLEEGQTLYSFRHTGAINVFNRTGSLVKLQHVMGHSSLNVTLTYLRGLEVPMIELCDMPELG